MGTSIIGNSDIIMVLRGTKVTDEYGSEVTSWDVPLIAAAGRASIQHFLTTEDDSDRQTTTEGLRLITDDPALFNVMEPTDRILYAGVSYEIDAPIQHWRLFGKIHHVEVYLRRVVG